MSDKRCPACSRDPDPREPSACHACREINAQVDAERIGGLYRAIEDHVAAIRSRDAHDVLLTEIVLEGAIAAYVAMYMPDDPDLSDAHVDRVARRLYRAFDDARQGHEPLHDFDVMGQCQFDGRLVIINWRALAREAIRLGTVVEEGS
jgi:hypothetical protein